MINGSIDPVWTNHRYAGGGTYYINPHYLCASYRVYGEVRNVSFDGPFTVLQYERNSVDEDWEITEHTDQIYVSYYLETFDYTRRFDGGVSDGTTVNTNRYDVQRIILNMYYVNTGLFEINPPDWEPDIDEVGIFYKLGNYCIINYSALQWYLDENFEPRMDEIPDSAEYTLPVPSYQWVIDDRNEGFPINGNVFSNITYTNPMPVYQWRIQSGYNDGFPYNELLLNIPVSYGAFEGAENLEKVGIPVSVKEIGEKAFASTALTEVTIASDCTYYGTSFPTDCVINIYPE